MSSSMLLVHLSLTKNLLKVVEKEKLTAYYYSSYKTNSKLPCSIIKTPDCPRGDGLAPPQDLWHSGYVPGNALSPFPSRLPC